MKMCRIAWRLAMGSEKKRIYKKGSRAGHSEKSGAKTAPVKAKGKTNPLRVAAVAVCVIAVLMVAVGYGFIQYMYNKTNYVADEDVSTLDMAQIESYIDDDDSYYIREDVTDSDGNVVETIYNAVDASDLSPEERESLDQSVEDELNSASEEQSQVASEVPIKESGDVYNLLLVGVDLRAGQNWNGNSDTMILISINSAKRTITMTSFMRDLYANISGYGGNKLNRAFALGGGPFLVQTIEENYRIDIDNYAWVNFYSLIDIVDAMGGVTMEVSSDEAAVANNYIAEMCNGIGLDASDYYIPSSGGTLLLNGMQTVGYSRIRYVGNADFGRTERQRKVLTQMFNTLKTRSAAEVMNFLNTVLPLVTHNIPSDTVTNLVLNSVSYLQYDLKSQRIPYDGTYTSVNEMLIPDFDYTISMLQSSIY